MQPVVHNCHNWMHPMRIMLCSHAYSEISFSVFCLCVCVRREGGGGGFNDCKWAWSWIIELIWKKVRIKLLRSLGTRLVHTRRVKNDIMVSRIVKEKYCPQGYFLKAQIGHKPSDEWRNIWNASKLLKACLVWRVRDGSNIKIWEDKWLLNPSTYVVWLPVRILDRDARVQ